MPSEMTRRIEAVLSRVPVGRVTSYGAVAAMAGLANGARQVVRVLHACSKSRKLPWHRILRKDGTIALPRGAGFELQKALLESEGVEVSAAGRVDLARFAWRSGSLTRPSTSSGPHRAGIPGTRGSPRSRGGQRPNRR